MARDGHFLDSVNPCARGLAEAAAEVVLDMAVAEAWPS